MMTPRGGSGTMNRKAIIIATIALVVVSLIPAPIAAQPETASGPDETVDECMNAEEGPGANGPPSFVGDLMPDFLGDLFAGLPVPNFVKSFFGAPTC